MNFLTSVSIVVAFLQVEAVPYGSPTLDDNTTQYTLYAMAGAVALPLVIGIIYVQISLYRARRAAAALSNKNTTTNEVFSATMTSKKSILATYIVRLNDMRSNPVLRLWWNRQAKLYSTADNDLEAQKDTDLQGDGAFPSSSLILKKQMKEKKADVTAEKKSKKEKKADSADDGNGEKKSKKEKKDKKLEQQESLTEPNADGKDPKLKKEKKQKHEKKSKMDTT
jgi:hypothetical protein